MAVKNVNEEFSKLSGWFLALGILFMLFGFALIILPVVGTITVELLFGLLLLLLGISELVFAFTAKKWTGFVFLILGGLVSLIAGLILLFNPIAGMIALTLFLGLFLIIQGIIKTVRSFSLRKLPAWGWFLFDGLITLLLGILITMAWPSDSIWVIGLLFGIDMLFGGISFIVLSQAAKK
jgi:uncharacterized membrane protein HdeD (DUF308 family)